MNSASLIRFIAKLQPQADGCWLWTGATSKGYGHFLLDRKIKEAHRVSYEHFVGPIPEGHEMDHFRCQRKACVNPKHLEPVPIAGRMNSVRHAALQTHCKRGHEFTEANTYRASNGHRSCRICRREAERRWRDGNPERFAAQQARANDQRRKKRA